MANNYALSCLVEFMDDLWFRDVILFSEPWTSSLCSKIHKPSSMAAVSEELSYSSSNDSQTPLISDEDFSSITNQAEYEEKESDEKETTTCTKPEERPTRLNIVAASTARSHSSSPSSLKRSTNLRSSSAAGTTGRRLHKTMSCKSLCELELEEVQGFMDLGFIFNKETMSKRMMSVIPGLQRLELSGSTQEEDNILMGSPPHTETERVEEGEEAEQHINRPYLSEAWLIRRPDSPLLNLRIPSVSTAADMKKRLKYWAKTVASAILLES